MTRENHLGTFFFVFCLSFFSFSFSSLKEKSNGDVMDINHCSVQVIRKREVEAVNNGCGASLPVAVNDFY